MAKKGTTKYESNKQEKDVAKKMGGKVVIASGALEFAKGDVKSPIFLIECKTTAKDYYVIQAKIWEKINKEALRERMRTPLLIVDLNNEDRYVIFNPDLFTTPITVPTYSNPFVHGGCASYKFHGYIEDMPVTFGIQSPNKYYILVAMKEKDFKRHFEKEIAELLEERNVSK